MKKIFAIFCALTFTYITSAQTSGITSPPVKSSPEALSLKETEYDFGKIPQGKPVTHVFEFSNLGDRLFILNNVQASCGCTTPVWNHDTLATGASSKITVGYNAMNEGSFTKFITITYNGTQSKQILIKGEVWKTPSDSAPENAALNSLKNQ